MGHGTLLSTWEKTGNTDSSDAATADAWNAAVTTPTADNATWVVPPSRPNRQLPRRLLPQLLLPSYGSLQARGEVRLRRIFRRILSLGLLLWSVLQRPDHPGGRVQNFSCFHLLWIHRVGSSRCL